MAEPRDDGGLVRYYCTAGNGMEPFVTDEVCQMTGKVLFSSSARIDRVIQLKAAERLFLLLKHDSPVQLSTHSNRGKAVSVLQSRLLGDRNEWTNAVMTWSRLQGELGNQKSTERTISTTLGVKRKAEAKERGSEEQRAEEEKCSVETGKSTGEQKGEERGIGGLRLGEENGAETLEKKRKREERIHKETCLVGAQTLWKKMRRDNEAESDVHATTEIDHDVESGCTKTHDTEDCPVENVEHVKATGREDKTLLQPSKIKPEITSSVPVSFRISCKCTGSLSRYFSTQEVSKVIGVGLSRLLGWKADLKNPQLEVNVLLNDDHCLLGIPLTRLPLANRSYIKTTGLRSTPGFCVVDPMCGVGSILIEAAQEHKAACFMGVDIDERQLQKANENIEFAEMGNTVQLLKASSMELPLTNASVDAVVCDLPFGKKFGTKTDMAANLPVILTEMERVLHVGGILVLLLSPQLSCVLKNSWHKKTLNQHLTRRQNLKLEYKTASLLLYVPQRSTRPKSIRL
ncbi:hypothetical protein INR49_007661 [Caranx melampygus]|nr:hypothetical protein INR49_007661 [Caranx melampygus]